MSSKNYWPNGGATIGGLPRMFATDPIAAEVPPVRLTNRDWADIQKVIASLGALSCRAGGLESAIIHGAAIADEAKLAAELMGRLGIEEESE